MTTCTAPATHTTEVHDGGALVVTVALCAEHTGRAEWVATTRGLAADSYPLRDGARVCAVATLAAELDARRT